MSATNRDDAGNRDHAEPADPRLEWIDGELARLGVAGLRRELPSPLGLVAPSIRIDGREVVNFSSNDYLGLAGDPRLAEAAAEACRSEGVGRGASPLVSGRSGWHDRLERELARFDGCEAALLFPSGFAANSGTIPALVGEDDAVFSDALNHASIVDGCRLARGKTVVFRHTDVDHLDELLRSTTARRKLVVTDTVFSLDGDAAPLTQLTQACRMHGAMLMVDEAHATGVLGPTGRGLSETLDNPATDVQVRIGTLSKALGSSGGFVAGSQGLIDWIANRARSYVYSTAHPAAASAAAFAALQIVDAEPERRQTVQALAESLRQQLQTDGWDTGRSTTQIVPVVVGCPERTVRLARRLREAGYWVGAIRPPSVPEGGSMLRIGVTAAHTPEMVAGLVESLREAVKDGS